MHPKPEADASRFDAAPRAPVASHGDGEPEPDAAPQRQPPPPLRQVVIRARAALGAMASLETTRRDMHDFRNTLSDLCALTYPNAAVTAAVARVVAESDCFAELAFGDGAALTGLAARQRCYDRVWNTLQQVNASLADARPSTVARALGRDW